ncbi:MAG: hypothetical protein U1D64_05290, partial [Bacteroidales bacterium]|nr:hypothetical protein [Bacteroidales bacterium]
MITTKILVREHICEYAIGKFGVDFTNPVKLPSDVDLYYTIWDLMAPRPVEKPIDRGNLEIIIPNRRSDSQIGKNPEKFNYLSERSAKIIDYKLETMMLAEL